MASTSTSMNKSKESFKRINSILISQPKPERSAYFDIEQKWGIRIDWRPFIHVEGVTEKEYRKNRLRPDEFTSIIFTSLNSIEHFFRLTEEMRVVMSQDTKYFCLTQSIANYLQKYILYRKRKVFVGTRQISDLENSFLKHKNTEKFLVPCSNLGAQDVVTYLTKLGLNFQESMMYRTVSSDLSDLKDITYDCLVFFSPYGIKSLLENFPDFKQNETRLAIYGSITAKEVEDNGFSVDIAAPAPDVPSMSMAIENYLEISNK
jgi:uroporphyrinogen-III synthase